MNRRGFLGVCVLSVPAAVVAEEKEPALTTPPTPCEWPNTYIEMAVQGKPYIIPAWRKQS